MSASKKVSSVMPKTEANDVFLVSAMSTLATGATTERIDLRQDDLAHRAGESQADRSGGLRLADRHGVDACSQHFADEGSGVERPGQGSSC